jgi:AraC family transcriptional regulator, arabinose operon regulatory protein
MKRKDGFRGQRAIVLPETIISIMEQNPLTSALLITNIGYYPNAESHFRERLEGISQYIFIYCVKGKGWFDINGVTKNVNENQFFILPANIPHSYGSNEAEPWTIYWIHFKGFHAQYFLEPQQSYPKNITPGENSRIEYRNQLFEKIYSTLEMGYSLEHLQYASMCLHYYLASLMYINLFRDDAFYLKNTKEKDLANSAIHFMRENIEKKIIVEDIARELHISTSYFSTQFQKSTGFAPIAYLNNLRIQKACQYLDFTDMKINQLCHKIGYEDAYYFSRIFTKTMGISPKEYKKRKKG